ncbi:recombinase family protein [Enterococcus avium]|uniref:recombinase family protein n=1 Tax=Enterococcus TaxID=1350 RepID=UPI001A9754B0|nr:recombinase family protein [Enterococcus avium]MBO1139872.1 recombinase family protein [Enterococcus avium]
MQYGYARVSTLSQSTNEQMQQLLEFGVLKKNIYSDKFTGTKSNRPAFTTMLDKLRSGDMIVVTKLDRFARNTREALEIIEPLLDDDITIKVLNLGTIENTPMGRMIVRTLLSVAEMERDMIVERTQEGKAFAKKNNPNYREGRPKATLTGPKRHAYELMQQGLNYKDVEERTGFSRSTLYRIKKMKQQSEG